MNEDFVSNTSYVNKDFESIYTELLDLVKKLSNKWDPSLSNESDPGVLLLKLNALVADKNNYNIDKNVLECFPLSVTQESNARKIYDLLGYNMHWYIASSVNIGFQYINPTEMEAPITIPQFTMITDASNQYTYTTIQPAYLSLNTANLYDITSVNALEGVINDLIINNSTNISITSLDSDLRLYFEETNIAQNGIFIKTSEDSQYDWVRVDNLSVYPAGSKVYQFGVLPNSNTCYIQFPEDVATLLRDTPNLNIKYIVSNGQQGNIKANTLSLFLNNESSGLINGEVTDVSEQVKIIQTTNSSGGQNPEDIDSAYRNYKKTIGTFNTLITRRDYENFIYNATINNQNIVSNCVVADRTNDINCSTKVQVWNPNYETTQLVVSTNDADQPLLNAYSIVLYALQPGDGTYDSTFAPYTTDEIAIQVENLVEEVKAVQHDFEVPSNLGSVFESILYLFKNLFKINGQIITYERVTQAEADEIELNVINALKQTYNAREISFGESLDYNKIIDVITKADDRIRSVALELPKYQIWETSADATNQFNVTQVSNLDKISIVARMILSGNVQLFEFDESFNYEFGQQNINVIGNENNYIHSITTEASIQLEAPENNELNYYTLQPNESVQIYSPNLVVLKEYSSYVKFNFYTNNKYLITNDTNLIGTNTFLPNCEFTEGTILLFNINDTLYTATASSTTFTVEPENTTISNYFSGLVNTVTISPIASDNSSQSILKSGCNLVYGSVLNNGSLNYSIPANTDHTLTQNELIKLSYIDTNNITQVETLKAGTIINCNKNISAIATTSLNIDNTIPTSYSEQLLSGQYLRVKGLNQTTLNIGTKIYYIINNANGILNITPEAPYILQENEYFIYTNARTSELMILGSGTMLSTTAVLNMQINQLNITDINNIQESNIQDINWYSLPVNVTITELNIISLGEGAQIAIDNTDTASSIVLNNNATKLIDSQGNPLKLILISNNGEESIYTYTDGTTNNLPYSAFSRLNINTSIDNPQLLYPNQSMKLYITDDISTETPTIIDSGYIVFNQPVIMGGGVNLDMASLNSESEYIYNIIAYNYTLTNADYSINRQNDILTYKGQNDMYYQDGNEYKWWLPFTFSNSSNQVNWLLPIYANIVSSSGNINISTSSTTFNSSDLDDVKWYTNIPLSTSSTQTQITRNDLYPLSGTPRVGDKIINEAQLTVGEIVSYNSNKYIAIVNTIANRWTNVNLKDYTSNTTSFNSGNYTIAISGDNSASPAQARYNLQITFNNTNVNDTLYLGLISNIIGLNSTEIDVISNGDTNYSLQDTFSIEDNLQAVKQKMLDICGDNIKFNWTYKVTNEQKVLQPTASSSYWNINHLCNKYTIAQIDFNNSKLEVNPYSIRS